MVKEEMYHIALDDYEHGIIIRSLNDEKTDLMNEGKSTDAVDLSLIHIFEGKSYDRSNVKAYSTYGTSRINAYKIIEETLKLKDVRIFDYIEDEDGKQKAVLNKKETAIAQAKQELIKQGFQDWVWADPTRREKLTKMYNEKFNSIRPVAYTHLVGLWTVLAGLSALGIAGTVFAALRKKKKEDDE